MIAVDQQPSMLSYVLANTPIKFFFILKTGEAFALITSRFCASSVRFKDVKDEAEAFL